jgi:NTP pyrophosphatase (non-canonical NTP hydrolase)
VTIDEFQKLIEQLYYSKDKKRGIESTFMWFVEEVGELGRAIRKARGKKHKELEEEFADCFAWLITLASLTDVKLEKAINKYKSGCPKCHKKICICNEVRRM